MRYAEIKYNDIANGNGVCVSYWCQGCSHRCKGCHNPQTWNPDGGQEGEIDSILKDIIQSIPKNGINRNFSVLGGEPLDCNNLGDVEFLINNIRTNFPNIQIYLWTGYVLEDLTDKQLKAIANIDVLIDGRFEEDLKDLTLKLRGSSNQRILSKEDIYGEIEKRKGKLRTSHAVGVARLKE